ncbi:32a4ba1a-127b-4cfe-9ede-0615152c5c09 [Thermothielavioides terrestris]|uniref:Endoplasmic reticulum lectin n=1 Tax=Thermothielavioides terrestris TaxID=2587410 RepID=A0A446BX64_9PEZI|nr:32a4ba1a-127b-4cfe-9ede-0615152c5c09 [Thermothielavioides terrestris]
MRRLNLVLLASLQLCAAQHQQPSFSIHDDLLAHPQFEVVFADDFISEADAIALLESSRTSQSVHPSGVPPSDLSAAAGHSGGSASSSDGRRPDENDQDAPIAETYELINSAPWRYLCSVPVIAPPPVLNETATELAKAEEARELSRASARGWELMSGLEGQCMYFVSGWWSYSFCYGKGVVQFHSSSNTQGGLPVRDQNTQEYILGRADKSWDPSEPAGSPSRGGGAAGQTKTLPPPNGQLQIKGDQRYLSQRLEDGTICDLNNRPRTIEIQYHCSPGISTDRIGWIKEVTTCTYLMAVYTPRLCADVAFQPPNETRAHPIRCRQVIGSEDEESAWRYHKRLEAGALFRTPKGKATTGTNTPPTTANGNSNNNPLDDKQFPGITVGGVVVGGKKLLAGEVAQTLLPLPPGLRRQSTPALVLASKKKGAAARVEALSDEELQKLNLNPQTVEEFRDEMQKRAGDRGWKLQVEMVPGEGYEFVGAFDDEEEVEGVEADYAEGRKAEGKKGGEGTVGSKQQQRPQEAEAEREELNNDDEEGSQEVFFKEEL